MNSTLWNTLISGLDMQHWVRVRDLGIRGSVPQPEHNDWSVPGLMEAIEADQVGETIRLLEVRHPELAMEVARVMSYEPQEVVAA